MQRLLFRGAIGVVDGVASGEEDHPGDHVSLVFGEERLYRPVVAEAIPEALEERAWLRRHPMFAGARADMQAMVEIHLGAALGEADGHAQLTRLAHLTLHWLLDACPDLLFPGAEREPPANV